MFVPAFSVLYRMCLMDIDKEVSSLGGLRPSGFERKVSAGFMPGAWSVAGEISACTARSGKEIKHVVVDVTAG